MAHLRQITAVLGLVALTCAGLSAQLPSRECGGIVAGASRGEASWMLRVPLRSSQLKWNVLGKSEDKRELLAEMPFDRAGSCIELADDRFMLSGLDSEAGVGRMVLLQLRSDPREIVIESVVTYESVDPWQLLLRRDEGRLYVHDFTAGRLLVTEFTDRPDRRSPLPQEAELREIATAEELPGLSWATADLWSSADDGLAGVKLTQTSCIGPYECWRVRPTEDGEWLKVTLPARYLGDDQGWFFAASATGERLLRASGPVFVGGAAQPYRIIDLDLGEEVASGENRSEGFEIVELPDEGLRPGGKYRIESVDGGRAASRDVVIYSRWGEPASNAGLRPQPLYASERVRAGSTGVTLYSRVFIMESGGCAADTSEELVAPAYCWIGVNRGDPVLELPGGRAVIKDLVGALGPIGVVIQGRRGGRIRFDVPIPADPELEGVELLFQLAIADGDDVRMTEVIGAVVLPSEQAAVSYERRPPVRRELPDSGAYPPLSDWLDPIDSAASRAVWMGVRSWALR